MHYSQPSSLSYTSLLCFRAHKDLSEAWLQVNSISTSTLTTDRTSKLHLLLCLDYTDFLGPHLNLN